MKLIKIHSEYYFIGKNHEKDKYYSFPINTIKYSETEEIIASTKEIDGIAKMIKEQIEKLITNPNQTEWEVTGWGHYNTKTYVEIIDII